MSQLRVIRKQKFQKSLNYKQSYITFEFIEELPSPLGNQDRKWTAVQNPRHGIMNNKTMDVYYRNMQLSMPSVKELIDKLSKERKEAKQQIIKKADFSHLEKTKNKPHLPLKLVIDVICDITPLKTTKEFSDINLNIKKSKEIPKQQGV